MSKTVDYLMFPESVSRETQICGNKMLCDLWKEERRVNTVSCSRYNNHPSLGTKPLKFIRFPMD